MEEIAWWLALGSIPGLTFADFAACDVAQNGELLSMPRDRAPWALCHYYSHNLERVVEWLRQPRPYATRDSWLPTLHRCTAQPAAALER